MLEGLAGLEGIAAGRAFDSDLVRAVVAAIYAESDAPPLGNEHRVARATGHLAAPVVGHLDRRGAGDSGPRTPGAVPNGTIGSPDCSSPATPWSNCSPIGPTEPSSAAYRQWVQSVAARVRRAAHPVDRYLGTAGEWLSGADGGFLGRLGTALGLR